MTEKEKIILSKFMSLVLRHEPERIGIVLDDNGWADTNELIERMNHAGHRITLAQLKEIVETNDKKRFKFSGDFSKIRASQGHSISVDVELKEALPPIFLYHGTATRFVDSIKSEGLIAKSRLYVYLSTDRETAVKVGERHGRPAVLTVDAGRMYNSGFKFYLSDNNVWLTASVPIEYILEYGL
ncbi:MAG: RNA 2'-phosphotransferase [Oscillospiraceae bacterium]|nr:RNA 2'-phosphotransferase [Oscillospiraceae bacterium]